MSTEKFAATFPTTERLAAPDLRRYQLRAIERIARHARAEVPFYRDRLAALFDANDRFRPEAWEDVPVLTRAEAQERSGELKAASWPAQAGEPVPGQTSGSTGMSFRHLRSTLAVTAASAMSERLYEWHGFDADRTFAGIVVDEDGSMAPPEGKGMGRWSRSGRGEARYLDITGTSVGTQVDWLARVAPGYLLTFPSAAQAIAEECRERGVTLPLDAIMLVGETISDERRAAIEAASGARVVAVYGAHELGALAGQCPGGTHYHVFAESVHVELLDEDGTPAKPGETGKVVVTDFYNFAMPFIRYAPGDYAVSRVGAHGGACSCGRTLPMIETVVGRQSCIFAFPGGRRVWPQAASSRLQELMPNRQYQIAQTGPLAVEYRYVPRESGQKEDREGLVQLFKDVLDPRIAVTIRALDAIPRRPGGKYDEYVREVPDTE